MLRMNGHGDTAKDAHINQSKSIVRQQIMNSYNRYDVHLNLNEKNTTYCITRDIDGHNERKFVFIPDVVIRLGDYVTMGEKTYLLTREDTNEVSPEFVGLHCTSHFPVIKQAEKVLVGYDRLKRPIYEESEPSVTMLPCVVKMNDASTAIASTNEAVNNLANQIKISIAYTEASSIQYNEIFIIYDTEYRIIRIDPSDSINGVGVLHITGDRIGEVTSGGDS